MKGKVIFVCILIIIFLLLSGLFMLQPSNSNGKKGQRRDPLHGPLSGSNPSKEKPWPMYQHDLQHTGYTNETGIGTIDNYGSLWHRTNQGGYSAIADFNNDGKNDIVLITDTGRDNTVHLFSADGDELWKYYTGSDMWHTPAIADINDDDNLEIVVPLRMGKALIALSWNGKLLWKYNTSGLVENSPAIADIDNDGRIEIIFGDGHMSREEEKPSHVYAIISDGDSAREVWRYATPPGGYITSSFPALADINNDGELETIIGVHGPGSISNPDYSYMAALDSKGKEIWKYTVGTDVGVPTVGDIDGNGDLETLFSEFGYNGRGTFYCLDKTGKKLWDFQLSGKGGMDSPSIADFDNDGKLEIIVTSIKKTDNHKAELYMLDHEGKEIWTYTNRAISSLSQFWAPTAIADLNGDNILEIITGNYQIDYEEETDNVIKKGYIIILDDEGNDIWRYEFQDPQGVSSILIADLDGDKTLEIIANTGGNIVEHGYSDDPPYYTFYFWLSPSEGIWVFGDSSQTNLIDKQPNLFIEDRNVLVVEEDQLHFKIVVAVYNLGHLEGANNVIVEIRTNDNMTLIAEENIGSLQPVSWKKIEFEYTAITSVPRTVWVRVDTQNSITESNESDNLASGSSE